MSQIYQITPKRKNNIFNQLSLTFIFIILNVLVFVLAAIFGFFGSPFCNETVCKYIAITPKFILEGNYLWTFITSMFMHGGFFHLFANMLSLFFIGTLVERIIGRKRYFWFYLISGLFASIFFILIAVIFGTNLNIPAVGASGALFGLVGLLMLLTPNLPVYVMFIPIPIKMKYAAPGILVLLWLVSVAANIPVGNTAHLGGLIAGLAYGIYLRKKYKNKTKYIRKVFS